MVRLGFSQCSPYLCPELKKLRLEKRKQRADLRFKRNSRTGGFLKEKSLVVCGRTPPEGVGTGLWHCGRSPPEDDP